MKVGWRPLELSVAAAATDRTRSLEKFGVAAHSKDRSRPLDLGVAAPADRFRPKESDLSSIYCLLASFLHKYSQCSFDRSPQSYRIAKLVS